MSGCFLGQENDKILCYKNFRFLLKEKNMLSKLPGIDTPDSIKVSKNFQQLRIVKKWFGLKFIFLTLFVIIWDAFLINWY